MVKSIKDYGSINIPAIAVSYVDVGLDNSTHLSMINDSLQLNRGVIYKSNEAKDVVLQSTISSYPPAWHSANAVIIESFYSKIKVGGQSIIAYVLTKFFWLFVLIFLFSRVVFDLFQILIRPDKHRRLLPAYTWLIGGIGFFSYYILIEQFEQGFYTFLPLLISLLIAIPLLIQLNFDNKENLSNKSRVLLPIILIVANLTLSWFLILPAVTIAILFAFLYPTKNNKVRDALLGMWSELSRVLPLVVLTVLAIVVQIILITVPSSQTFRVSIDTPGSIAIPAVAYFGFIFTGLALLYLLIHRQLSKLLDNLTLLLVFLLGFSFLIYLFQILTIQQPQYYYYKTLYTAMIVAMPMAIIGWLLLIELVTNKYRQLTAVILVFGLLICFPLIIGIQPPNGDSLFNYVIGRRALTTTESAYIYNSVSARARVPLDKRTSDVIFYEPGQIVDNIVATNILRGIKPVTNCDNEMFNDLFNDSETGLFSTIKGCETNPLTIVTNPDSYQLLKNLASSYNLGSNVTIRQID